MRRKLQHIIFIMLPVFAIMLIQSNAFCEGTKQLEPNSKDRKSICKLLLSKSQLDQRIPFALVDCNPEYRLNIRVGDFTTEKIYIGFGNPTDYYDTTWVIPDIKFRIKDPAGNIVPGFDLQNVPYQPDEPGHINNRLQANEGPQIGGIRLLGYNPLIIVPTMNGDYFIEFEIPDEDVQFKFFDITVAADQIVKPGRMWSKAWQLSSGQLSYSEALLYLYSSDSIVTSFDCNELEGGMWTIYSNEWGCSTTGSWKERKKSIAGNTDVEPQYMIFINDPDRDLFPSGTPGKIIDAVILPHSCDSTMTFATTVNKNGNLIIKLDLPPITGYGYGPEDIQFGYEVVKGYNILSPSWNGRNGLGEPLKNGDTIEAHVTFLNGLTNIPLYDLEDNPKGFKVDVIRPLASGAPEKLSVFWDDSNIDMGSSNPVNVLNGCTYSGVEPLSGCHNWTYGSGLTGNLNTVNTYWYMRSDSTFVLPVILDFMPQHGRIFGPPAFCPGQLVTFIIADMPYADQYLWKFEGPGTLYEETKDVPDSSFAYFVPGDLPPGNYQVSVFGRNFHCGDGPVTTYEVIILDEKAPEILQSSADCINTVTEYYLQGHCTTFDWKQLTNGEIIGSNASNPVKIKWNALGTDTVKVLSYTPGCGLRLSSLPVTINPLATVDFDITKEAISCPGVPLHFTDKSMVTGGSVSEQSWDWGDGNSDNGNLSQVDHYFMNEGKFDVNLTVKTDKGCYSALTKPIDIIPFPNADFGFFHNCINQNVEFTDISTGTEINKWRWNFGSTEVIATNTTSQKPDIIYNSTGIFNVKLTITNKFECADSVVKQVLIHPKPIADFTHGILCQGTDNLFHDNSFKADTLITDYSWKVGTTDGIIRYYSGNPGNIYFSQSSDYVVQLNIIDGFGCFDSISRQLSINPQPNSDFGFTENYTDRQGLTQFTNHTTGASQYFWDFGNNNQSSEKDPQTTYTAEDEYLIRLISTSEIGCHDTLDRLYYYLPALWVPDAFTPNNDGINDVFRPVTKRSTLKPYIFQIYNNWGQLIFESTDPEIGWDGNVNGTICSSGYYYYVIKYRAGEPSASEIKTSTGIVMLLR